MKVDELIGSLQNFELNVNNKTDKKGKGIAFVSNVDAEKTQGNHEDDESLSKNIVLLGKKIRRISKQVDKRPMSNVQNIRSNIDNQPGNMKNARTGEKINQSKGVQCHECEAYGHIRTECATFLKRQMKSLVVSWSDEDDSKGKAESESTKHVIVLTGRVMSDIDSCDEVLPYEELAASYNELIARSTDMC